MKMFLVLTLVLLAGCAASGTATDKIARVYYQNLDGCLDQDGYSGWSIQLLNDHPTSDSRNSYQIRDSMVKTAQSYADLGTRVRISFSGSNFDSDCDRITDIQPV